MASGTATVSSRVCVMRSMRREHMKRISRYLGAGLFLFTACGEAEPQRPVQPERVEVVVQAPPPEPVKPVTVPIDAAMLTIPRIGFDLDGCALDVDVPMMRLASPIASLVVVARRNVADENSDFSVVDCAAPALFELPGALLAMDSPRSIRGLAMIRMRVAAGRLACDEAHAIGVCLRDRGGVLHASLLEGGRDSAIRVHPNAESWLNAPRLLTPSGWTDDTLGLKRGWVLVGADPSTGKRTRVVVRNVRPIMGPAVKLKLMTGEVLRVPETRALWHVARASWVPASEISAGDRVYGVSGPVEVREVEAWEGKHHWADVTDVSAPDTYFIGDVLVSDGRPTPGELVPLSPEEDPLLPAPVEFAAAVHSYDCALRTTIELREWPEYAERVVLLAATHPGPSGARLPLACNEGTEVASIPRSVWEVWRTQRRATDQALVLSLDTGAPGWEAEEAGFDGVIGCASEVALLSCARAADGSMSPIMKTARWGLSGAPCFATGTPIETPDGPVAIESLGPGTLVRSFDVVSGEARVTRVLRLVSRGSRPVVRIRLQNGEEMRVTGEHPLWSPRVGDFRPAGSLRIGDRLLGTGGIELNVDEVAQDGTSEVWELSVAAPDTYFAGGVLAHNY